jgi:hypothetical protein
VVVHPRPIYDNNGREREREVRGQL